MIEARRPAAWTRPARLALLVAMAESGGGRERAIEEVLDSLFRRHRKADDKGLNPVGF